MSEQKKRLAAGLVGCSFPHQTHVVGVGVLVAAFF